MTLSLQHFKSDGEGQGSTFSVDLPVYLRTANPALALDRGSEGQRQPANDEIVAFLDSNRTPGPGSGPAPMEISPSEEVVKIERPRMQLLIVDDSAPNRSV